jgi:pimeloyl-ACP methyl ester carboxylesterase
LSDSSLYYNEYGPENATAIVFLHGGGAGGWMWRPVIRHLSEYRCLCPDQPEHGGSSHIAPFSMQLAATKVAELIQSQTAERKAHVVGLSEGAQIAVQLLVSAPETIRKAFISSALLIPTPGLGWAGSPMLLKWTYRLFMRPFINNDWWIRLNMKYAAGIPNEYFSEFKKDFQHITETEFVNLMVANQGFRLPTGLENVTVPTIVIAGKNEYPAMRHSVFKLVETLADAKGGLLNLGKGSSLAAEHNWALTKPELFAQTLRAWIEDKPLPMQIEEISK